MTHNDDARDAPTVSADSASTEHERRAPTTTPADAPQSSRTQPASGDRGTGGGLGDAIGGARQATGAEMTGHESPIGDVSVQTPTGGSRTQGAAQGAGMSGGAGDPSSVSASDPGAGSETTAGDPAGTPERADDASRTGLGGHATGGRLEDYDAALRDKRE